MNQVLVVDDEAGMRLALEENFRRDGWQVETAVHAVDALEKFRAFPAPLVITDMRMAGGDGLAVLRGIREARSDAAVIFLTAFANVPEAVEAMREGACDYLVKPVGFEQLRDAARRVLAKRAAAGGDGNGAVRRAPQDLVGDSPAMRRALKQARQAARSDVDVLIEAESGTGKELLARMIHASSERRARAFVAVNCAAFPEALLESELFGHARGAFTGALAAKPGKFEVAHRGTLLLDEIGELPLPLQPKLLRVLQEREVDRLGETRPFKVDVRVIATTNRNLSSLVAGGNFRADLYYRLNVLPLTMPPLRERLEDVAALAEHFLAKYGAARAGMHSLARGALLRFSDELKWKMAAYAWPGNVRELENFVRRAIALSEVSVIGIEAWDQSRRLDAPARLPDCPSGEPPNAKAGVSLRDMERQLLESTLAASGGNRTRAARVLGICPRTMRNKIREYGLPPRSAA